MPYCPQCGSAVDPDDAFCGNCGHALDGPAEGSDGAPDAGSEDASPDEAGGEPTEPPVGDATSETAAGAPTSGTASAAETTDADADESRGPSRVDIPDDPFEMDTFEFSFKYPLSRGYKPVGIGALLVVGTILLFPLLLLTGYGYRVGRAAVRGDTSPPAYGDWWGLLVDGFRFLLVSLVVGVLAFGGILAFEVLGLSSLALLWSFASSVAAAAAIPIFYGTGSFTDVFRDLRFLRFLFTAEFWIGYAYLLGIMLVLYIGAFVATIALTLTLVGILLWIPLWLAAFAYGSYVSAALWGRVYRDAAEDGVVDPVQDPERLESSW